MYKKGTIVLVPFPFTDLSGNKIRPALILSGSVGNDVVVAFITSVAGRKDQWDVLLIATSKNGLKVDSRVKCAKIATLDKKVILGELGVIGNTEQKMIDIKLRTLFSLDE
jgi:mRNA interferase MazF